MAPAITLRQRCRVQVPLLALAVCVMAPAHSWAQHADPAQPTTTLEPVVVTATKSALPLKEAASSITVIDQEEIRTRHVTEMIDLLPTVPGLHVSEQNSRGGLSFVEPRGAPFTFNQVLVDGVKFNQSGGVINWAGLSLTNFDRVEVLRGPQSALYGVDAAGSVIQFFTTRGEGPFRAEVSVGAGNQSTFEETASFQGSHGPFGYSFGAHRVDTDGNLRVNSDFRSTTLSGRVDLARAESLELTASFRFAESRHEVPVFFGGERFLPLDPRQFVEQEWLLLSGRAVHWIAPAWKHTLQLGYYRRDANLVDPFDPGVDVLAVTSENLERRYSVDYFWTVALPRVFGIEAHVTAGVAYEHETVDQKVTLGAPFPAQTFFTDGHRDLRSGYLQAQLDWNKRVFVTPGFRVDDSSVFGTAVSPRVSAAVLVPATRTKFRGAYGEGIRAPSFAQLIGDGGIGFVTGNPSLRPERAESWELGVDQSLLDGRVELGATYFRTRFEDLITFVAGASPSSRNVQTAEAHGVELTAKVRPVTGLTLTGAYNYLRTEILANGGVAPAESPKGAPLVRQPTHGGSLTIDYVRARLTASATGIFVGEREDVDVLVAPPGRVKLAGYYRVDTAVSYTLLKDVSRLQTLSVFGKVRNLTDERYEDFFGFRAPSRTFLIGLRGTF